MCYNFYLVSKFMNELGVFTFLTTVCRHQTEKREGDRGMSSGFEVNRRKI